MAVTTAHNASQNEALLLWRRQSHISPAAMQLHAVAGSAVSIVYIACIPSFLFFRLAKLRKSDAKVMKNQAD